MEEKKDPIFGESKNVFKSSKTKNYTWMIVSLVAIVLLIASVITGGFSSITGSVIGGGTSGAEISVEEAKVKALDFINTNLLGPGSEAEVNEIVEENGLYKMSITVAGQTVDSYVTKDGSLLFPSAIDLNQEIEAVDIAGEEEIELKEYPKTDVPEVKMFVMTFCPYGQQAENGLGPVAEALGNSVEIVPHFVIYKDYCDGIAERMGMTVEECKPEFCLGDYCSMHGLGELNEGIRQLCIYRYNKDKCWD